MKKKCCIVVPFFNESARIKADEFLTFVEMNDNFHLLFVDDGSTDGTKEIIEKMSAQSKSITFLSFAKNRGKAVAVRSGIMEAVTRNDYQYVAFLDADLAITLTEFKRLSLLTISNPDCDFSFFSKQKEHTLNYPQSFLRHQLSLFFNRLVRYSLKLDVKDTQCGCKIMKKEFAEFAFKTPFTGTWLFDLEIFKRIMLEKGVEYYEKHTLEVPLKHLQRNGKSKIKLKSLLKLPFEFIAIHFNYKTYNQAVK